jgi:hypothetical protein
MNKTFAVLIAAAFGLASALATADDKTPDSVSPGEQAKMNKEAAAKKAAMAKMTPEEKAAAKKAKQAEALKYEDTTEKITQNPKEGRNMAINKSAAASKADPRNPVNLNTPEVEQKLLKQKGQ